MSSITDSFDRLIECIDNVKHFWSQYNESKEAFKPLSKTDITILEIAANVFLGIILMMEHKAKVKG